MTRERFIEIYSQKNFWGPTTKILVDRKTGVNYLCLQNGNQGASVTPLLNPDGTPVVTPAHKFEE